MKNRKKSFLKLLLFIVLLIIVGLISRQLGLGSFLEQQHLQSWIESFGATGPLIYILIFIVSPVLFLPGLPITLAGGIVFGPIWIEWRGDMVPIPDALGEENA